MTHTIKIHNVETGEITERDMTNDEIAYLESMREQGNADEKTKIDKAKTRQAAYAKLGLTADEIAALAD